MSNKNMIWLVVALIAAYVLFSGNSKATTRRPGLNAPYPAGGPSPLGTSYAQTGPYAAATHQSNGYDLATSVVTGATSFGVALANNGVFGGGGSDGGDSYDSSYVDSLTW